MRRLLTVTFLHFSAFAWASVPAWADKTGTIAGKVTFEGSPPAMPEIDLRDPACAAGLEPHAHQAWVVVERGGVAGTLVRLAVGSVADRAARPATPAPAVIDQKGCLYRPRVVGVVAGQKVAFRNSDPTVHNVHTYTGQDADVNQVMTAGARDLVLDVPASAGDTPYRVRCDIHPWMDAFVVVTDHPYFATSSADGTFRIDNVPAGTYTIEAWHPYLGKKTATVTVKPGQTADTKLPAYQTGDYQPPAQASP